MKKHKELDSWISTHACVGCSDEAEYLLQHLSLLYFAHQKKRRELSRAKKPTWKTSTNWPINPALILVPNMPFYLKLWNFPVLLGFNEKKEEDIELSRVKETNLENYYKSGHKSCPNSTS